MSTLPAMGSYMRCTRLMKDDLPQPLAPEKATCVPASTVTVTPVKSFSSSRVGYEKTRSVNSILPFRSGIVLPSQKGSILDTRSMTPYTLEAAPRASASAPMDGKVSPMPNEPMSTAKKVEVMSATVLRLRSTRYDANQKASA